MVARGLLLLAQSSVWQKLSALDRARLTLALLAFIALFIGVVAFVLLIGRFAKREIRKPLPPIRNAPGSATNNDPPESHLPEEGGPSQSRSA